MSWQRRRSLNIDQHEDTEIITSFPGLGTGQHLGAARIRNDRSRLPMLEG
jgi:hypothetical protein